MYNFTRRLLSNAVVPAFALGILGIIFWIMWGPAHAHQIDLVPPMGKYSRIASVLSLSWPYFTAAIVSNLLSWHFTQINEVEAPFLIFLFNFIIVLIGILLLFLGPQW